MDKDAIDSIIIALRDAGHAIGRPALEHAATAIQIGGAVGIATGIASAAAAVLLARICHAQARKWYEVLLDRERYLRDEEVPHLFLAIASGAGTALVFFVALVMLGGDSWAKFFAPLGWLVVRGLGGA